MVASKIRVVSLFEFLYAGSSRLHIWLWDEQIANLALEHEVPTVTVGITKNHEAHEENYCEVAYNIKDPHIRETKGHKAPDGVV